MFAQSLCPLPLAPRSPERDGRELRLKLMGACGAAGWWGWGVGKKLEGGATASPSPSLLRREQSMAMSHQVCSG
jgi:hypothetical protein